MEQKRSPTPITTRGVVSTELVMSRNEMVLSNAAVVLAGATMKCFYCLCGYLQRRQEERLCVRFVFCVCLELTTGLSKLLMMTM